jgi:hypothetical protein
LARRFLTRHQQLPPGAGHAAIIVQDAEIDLDGAKAAAADHHRFLGAGGGSQSAATDKCYEGGEQCQKPAGTVMGRRPQVLVEASSDPCEAG